MALGAGLAKAFAGAGLAVSELVDAGVGAAGVLTGADLNPFEMCQGYQGPG